MIVPMKRIAVLCTAAARQETLDALQGLGALHIDASEAKADSDALREAQASLDAADKALALLAEAAKNADAPKAEPAPGATPEAVLAAAEAAETAESSAADLRAEAARYAAFGDFDPESAKALAASGIEVRLFRARPADLAAPKGSEASPSPAGTVSASPTPSRGGPGASPRPFVGLLRILSDRPDEDGLLAGVAIGTAEPPDHAEILPLPAASPRALLEKAAALDDEAAGHRARLAAWAPAASALRATRADRLAVRDFHAARAAMGASEGIEWLEGYIPAGKVEAVRDLARDHGWGVAARDPLPDENPPTVLAPPKLFRPIVALFDMLGIVPAYREADVSVVFYSFFTIFFAMLVGDAGYGLILLAITALCRAKFRKAPSAPFLLLTVFSLATIAWGALTCTWFGVTPEAKPPVAAWLDAHIMQICFFLGAVHLSAARLWNAWERFPDTKFLAELGWAGVVWTMYCVSCAVVIEGFQFPGFMKVVAVVSILLVALFMLKKSELKTEGINLGMLPLNIISGLGDIISYVRLYAVGLASVKLAENFNQMALGLSIPLWAKIPCVVLILLLGHGLNLAMAALSILVHAVRLNTLEFSNHKGISWGGYAYNPFKR